MSVTAAQVAEAVKVALNAGSFGQTFTAKRVYLPMELLSDLSDLLVVVAPKSDEWLGAAARRLRQNDISADIGIFKRLPVNTNPTLEAANTTLDALVTFVKAIGDGFTPTSNFGSLGISWVRTVNDPIYDVERLKNDNLFASLVTVTFRETSGI